MTGISFCRHRSKVEETHGLEGERGSNAVDAGSVSVSELSGVDRQAEAGLDARSEGLGVT